MKAQGDEQSDAFRKFDAVKKKKKSYFTKFKNYEKKTPQTFLLIGVLIDINFLINFCHIPSDFIVMFWDFIR